MTEWSSPEQLAAAFQGDLGPEVERLADQAIYDMASGEYGEEYQAQAEAFLGELGMTVDDFEVTEEPDYVGEEEDEFPYPDHAEATEAVEAEIEKLAKIKGRPLTWAEKERVIDAIPSGGPIPDLSERFGKEFAERVHSQTSRREAMKEAADDVGEEAEWQERPEPADTSDETPEGRRARMLAAAEASGEE